HVAPADDVDERPVEHARRRVDEDQHAPAAHAETRQILSIALTGDAADTVAGLFRRHARRGLPLDLRSERRELGLELLDRLATREAFLGDRKSTRLNSSHVKISYAVFCLKKKKKLH